MSGDKKGCFILTVIDIPAAVDENHCVCVCMCITYVCARILYVVEEEGQGERRALGLIDNLLTILHLIN